MLFSAKTYFKLSASFLIKFLSLFHRWSTVVKAEHQLVVLFNTEQVLSEVFLNHC